jgi:hypothetical protein
MLPPYDCRSAGAGIREDLDELEEGLFSVKGGEEEKELSFSFLSKTYFLTFDSHLQPLKLTF